MVNEHGIQILSVSTVLGHKRKGASPQEEGTASVQCSLSGLLARVSVPAGDKAQAVKIG